MTDKIIGRKNKEGVNAVMQAETYHKAMVIETLGVSVVKTNNQCPGRKSLVMDPCIFEHFMHDRGGITDQW